MVIDTALPKATYIRLSLLLFFQNRAFYIYLLICGIITVYALSTETYLLLLIAWLPYAGYLIAGLLATWRNASDKTLPFLLPTRYTFQNQEILTKTDLGEGKFKWTDFVQWRSLANCYVLFHQQGFILAIPRSDVKNRTAFERMLNEKIKR
ncbi:MAG TPA: YcxB family protein [Anaerolineae bacterium]|nr:YcxB family protein [Anaerolineae bacterium]HMR67882.1 YcxB family protein [Anaerolineae bacterium]